MQVYNFCMHHPTKQKIRATVGLLAGLLLLTGMTAYLGMAPSQKLTKTLSESQSAAVWWSTYTSYFGWPLSHTASGHNSTLGAWCNPGVYYCPLPSYADVYVTSNPAQAIVGKMNLSTADHYGSNPGPYWAAYTATYSGSIPTVPAGTSITLDWACQDW